MSTLERIRDFLQLEPRLGTSGMPGPDDFAAMRQAGYEVVINLALPTSDNAISNEGELVTAQGMSYVQIPVKFDAPEPEDFDQFTRIMEACGDRKVFVHCAANKRVSAFLFLHRLKQARTNRAQAERDLRRIWEPDTVWRAFINERLRELGQPELG